MIKKNFNMNPPMMNFYLITLMLMFNLISVFCTNYIWIWAIMDMNFIIYIFFISINNPSKINSIVTFFIIQSISSMIMIFMIINNIISMKNFFILFIIISFKMGSFPFNFWPNMLITKMNLLSIIIFSTLQKFIPIYLISMILDTVVYNNWIYSFLFMSIFFSSYQGLMGFNNLKIIMVNSSINVSSWMLLLSFMNSPLYIILFIFYSFILWLIYYSNKSMKKSKNKNSKISIITKIFFNFNFFLLSMIPPFSSFTLKYNLLTTMIYSNSLLYTILLLFLTIFSILMYIMYLFHVNNWTEYLMKIFTNNYWYFKKNPQIMYFFITIFLFFILITFFF